MTGWASGHQNGPVTIDLAWCDAVRAACDPVFLAADAGFVWNDLLRFSPGRPTLLWEADPQRFAARYPDSGVAESYGDQWPPPCLDYWVYVEPQEMTARLSTEGWAVPDPTLPLTGDGSRDGAALAARFAAILRVPG